MVLDSKSSGVARSYQRTIRAIEYLNRLVQLHEEQAEIYKKILTDIDNGELPEELAQTEFDRLFEQGTQEKNQHKKPDELRLPVYREMKLTEVVLLIFDRAEQETTNYAHEVLFSIDELTKMIYSAETKEELNACKGSLTAALNRCVNNQDLVRVKPGIFARNSRKREQDREQNLLFLYKQGGKPHAI